VITTVDSSQLRRQQNEQNQRHRPITRKHVSVRRSAQKLFAFLDRRMIANLFFWCGLQSLNDHEFVYYLTYLLLKLITKSYKEEEAFELVRGSGKSVKETIARHAEVEMIHCDVS
jgi:hypothetical protein